MSTSSKPAPRTLAALLTAITLAASTTHAAITTTGNIEPTTKPTTWTSSTTAYIGKTSGGTMTINTDSDLLSGTSYLGNNSGVIGTVTVDGSGSSWTNSGSITVGVSGTGNLNITNGGTVNSDSLTINKSSRLDISNLGSLVVTGTTNITATTGSINFGPNSGSFTTGTLQAATSQLTGNGTINTLGINSNIDLLFDTTHSPVQTLVLNDSGKLISINVDFSGTNNRWGDLGVGYLGNSNLTIKDGITVKSANGYLSSLINTAVTNTIDGVGSSWVTSDSLTVKGAGTTTLNLTNGANMTSNNTNIGGQNAIVNIDGVGSKWLNSGDIYVGNDKSGTLNITHGAVVSDTFGWVGTSDTSTQGTKIGTVSVDGIGSTWANSSALYAVNGSVKITNGGTVTCGMLMVDTNELKNTTTVTVDGPGSTLTDKITYVGFGQYGTSTLNVTNSGKIYSSFMAFIGVGFTGGTANIDGIGSSWTIGQTLTNGSSSFYSNLGILNIMNGGFVSAKSMDNYALLAMNIGDSSSLDLGAGTLYNSARSKIRLKASANLTPGNTYSPITAGTWTGTGTIQALGGTWNATTHTFTVSPITNGTAGTPLTINPLNTQRVAIYDLTEPLNFIGASFLSSTASSSITLTAALLSDTQKSLLQSLLPADATLLSGWNVSASGTGYATNDPIYLTLPNGGGSTLPATNLTLWHFDGTKWATITPSDFSSDNLAAYFTITSFSGYALTGTVPEPTTLSLLVLGSSLLLTRRNKIG